MRKLCYNNIAVSEGDNLNSYSVNIVSGDLTLISAVNIEKDNVLKEVWACMRIVSGSIKKGRARVCVAYESDGFYYLDFFDYRKLFNYPMSKKAVARHTKRVLKRIDRKVLANKRKHLTKTAS